MTREPIFEAPWHAQVFALTVHVHEAGVFTWPEWTERFGATLAAHGLDRALDGGNDYFTAWIETLEIMLADRGLADAATLAETKAAWEAAYLSTPHGMPVHLPEQEST